MDYNIVIDDSTETLNKKIRKAEKLCFNYIFVIGEKEEESNSINIRKGNKRIGVINVDEVIKMCNKENLYE